MAFILKRKCGSDWWTFPRIPPSANSWPSGCGAMIPWRTAPWRGRCPTRQLPKGRPRNIHHWHPSKWHHCQMLSDGFWRSRGWMRRKYQSVTSSWHATLPKSALTCGDKCQFALQGTVRSRFLENLICFRCRKQLLKQSLAPLFKSQKQCGGWAVKKLAFTGFVRKGPSA